MKSFTIRDKIWGIPIGIDPTVIFFNKDLFDEYGVPYPKIGWTWDEFISTAQKVHDPNNQVFSYVSNTGYWDALEFVHLNGGRIFNDNQNPTFPAFTDSLTVQAMEWYRDLYHKYKIALSPSDARKIFGGETWEAIERGIWNSKIAIWAEEFFHIGGRIRSTRWPMHWGVITFPRSTATKYGDLYSMGLAISSQTQHPEEAWKWVS